ncbi:hypothetical protein [Nonomuraea sediminis]|uniref:hypothetical protein n=1 Tax=Nonomuraea sediminis TaxID=2835864 RepID=UPI001BDD50C5|nr:hypothetical protein [Nonomuraea sediminis]
MDLQPKCVEQAPKNGLRQQGQVCRSNRDLVEQLRLGLRGPGLFEIVELPLLRHPLLSEMSGTVLDVLDKVARGIVGHLQGAYQPSTANVDVGDGAT